MAYQIDKYNKDFLTFVEDGTIDQSTDLKFIGKNYAGYGEIQNENFLFLLENFAGANPPPRKIIGQIWFDTSQSKLKFWDGTNWRNTGGAAVGGTSPSGLTEGDFWWNNANDQLFAWNGSEYVLVGPQTAGSGLTQMQSIQVVDNTQTARTIITAVIEEEVVYIISPTTFTIDSTDPENAIDGFSYIRQGITLKNTDVEGKTSTNHRFWGTSETANGLIDSDTGNIITASDFLTLDDLDLSNSAASASFPSNGITIGPVKAFKLYIDDASNDGVIENATSADSEIILKVTDTNSDLLEIAKVQKVGLVPGADNFYDLGSTSLRWDTVFATTFEGTATKGDTLKVGTNYRSASTSALADTIAVRDASANISANLFQGTATQARYADLAEKYSTAEELPVGTAVAVCAHEDHEVEPATSSKMSIGVVSAEPAYMMNSEAEGQYIGLKGRVPVRVKGPVSKGMPVYAWEDGVCTTIATTGLVGIALESNSSEEEKLVECVLKV